MVLQYGTELLLDSVIKIILYLVLGGILGKTKETLFALLTWCVIRKQTGGRHVKNNFVCFVISGSVIFSSVMIGSVLNITLKSKRLNFRHGYKNPRPHFCNRSTLIIHI